MSGGKKLGGTSGSVKVLLVIILVLVLAGGAFLLGSSSLFQGRIFRSSMPLTENKIVDTKATDTAVEKKVPVVVEEEVEVVGGVEEVEVVEEESAPIFIVPTLALGGVFNLNTEPHYTFSNGVVDGYVFWNKGVVAFGINHIDIGPDYYDDMYRITNVSVYEVGGTNPAFFTLVPDSDYEMSDDGVQLFEWPAEGVSTNVVDIGGASSYWKFKFDVYQMDYDGNYFLVKDDSVFDSFDNGSL
jgi:hypothetical protein